MPVPVSGTVCGLDASLSVTVSVAVSAPMSDGVNVTAIEHVAPTAIEPVHVELPTAKSAAFAPAIETFVIVSAAAGQVRQRHDQRLAGQADGPLAKVQRDGLRMTPVAAAGESFATNAAPVLNVV